MAGNTTYDAFGASRKNRAWAKIWFSRLCVFHKVENGRCWNFTADDVIAFLQSQVKCGVPAKIRLMMVRGIILYRNVELERTTPNLQHISAAETEKRTQFW